MASTKLALAAAVLLALAVQSEASWRSLKSTKTEPGKGKGKEEKEEKCECKDYPRTLVAVLSGEQVPGDAGDNPAAGFAQLAIASKVVTNKTTKVSTTLYCLRYTIATNGMAEAPTGASLAFSSNSTDVLALAGTFTALTAPAATNVLNGTMFTTPSNSSVLAFLGGLVANPGSFYVAVDSASFNDAMRGELFVGTTLFPKKD